MVRARLTDADRADILALRVLPSGDRRTAAEIKEIMDGRGRVFHVSTVSDVLAKVIAERGEILRAQVRKEIGSKVASDLVVVEEMMATLLDVFRRGRPLSDAEAAMMSKLAPEQQRIRMSAQSWNGTTGELAKLIGMRMRLAGVDDGEQKDHATTIAVALRDAMLSVYPLANKPADVPAGE